MESAVVEQEIEKGVVTVEADALAVKVVDEQTYLQAGEILTGIKGVEKKIKEYFKPLKEQAHKAWKGICDRENQELDKLKPAAAHLNRQMVAYHEEEERKRKEEERRLKEEARKREEEERLAAAIEAEKEGDKEIADAILDEPVHIPAPVMAPVAPKVAGLAVKTTWKAHVTSFSLLLKAVAEGKAPAMCLEVNQSFLDAQARAGKGTITFPGVEMREEKSMGGVRR